ncbi:MULTISPECIES: hypothetical protein [Marinobacter]|uniref:arsenate reductase/protein-tyrosine-phosphatase family protein n=1 Tax=Marinobacter TaxID=2742 RepID=UPI002942EE17|nr:hypothetical protein [Marinobacter salarius]WOI17655.1 hypothetical protein R1T46_12690 [Marinobacter salarius]
MDKNAQDGASTVLNKLFGVIKGYQKGDLTLDRLVYEWFGSRSGFLKYIKHWFLAQIGRYREFTLEPPERNRRIVFICDGNICRSPLAEVYARSLGRKTASCGFCCAYGFPADPRAESFASSQGLSLKEHRSQNITDFEFHESDFVVVMEPSHLNRFHELFGKKYPVVLAGNYCRHPNPYIHDPYNCCEQFFVRCEQRVIEAVRGICG